MKTFFVYFVRTFVFFVIEALVQRPTRELINEATEDHAEVTKGSPIGEG